MAANGALKRSVHHRTEDKQPIHLLGAEAAGPISRMGLLELQLQELVHSASSSPPGTRGGGASAVLADFVSFLKHFMLESFCPIRMRLNGSAATKPARNHSERAATLFCRIPTNTRVVDPEWEAPRPAKVEVIGSCGACFGPAAFSRNIDLAFEVPQDSIDKRDYLDYRYLAKRAAYVDAVHAQLEEALASAELEGSWHWAMVCRGRLRVESAILPWRFDGAKTFISLRFLQVREQSTASATAGKSGLERASSRAVRQLQQWEVRLIPSCSPDVFKENLLRPDANAVRRRTTATRGVSRSQLAGETRLTEAETKVLPPTPYYNGLVLEDTRFLRHCELLRACASEFPRFADAVMLLKAWAKRRSLLASGNPPFSPLSGVCGFTLSLVLAHVCRACADVARVAAPVQLFRLALSFLGTADFGGHVYCFGKPDGFPKTELTKSASALLEAAVLSRNEAADAVATAPAAAAAERVHHEEQVHASQWGRRELCVGLVEDACLFDSDEKTFNILWRAQLHIQELQHEARSSLAALQALEEPFLLLFGDQQEQLLLKSDLWVRVPSLPPCGDSYNLETTFPVANYEPPLPDQRHIGRGTCNERPTELPTHLDPPKWEAAPAFLGSATFARLVVRGLGDRLQTFRIRFSPAASKNVLLPNTATGSSADSCPVGVLLFVTLNGKTSPRLLDRGPPLVDNTEAASRTPRAVAAESFRRFWGPRCDIRRFQDGRMLHCVLWDTFSASEGPAALDRTVQKSGVFQTPPEQIVRAVLARHAAELWAYRVSCSKTEESNGDQRLCEENPLHHYLPDVWCSPLGANGPLSERQKALIRTFTALKNVLCALSSVPLTIKQIWHSDAALRHTEVVSSNTWESEGLEATTVHPIVIQFEDSGKWPMEREAVRRLKTAFLVAMNEELLRDYSVSSNVMESFLDVTFQSFIFRVHIFHPNEVMEEANIFTDFSLKPITTQLGKTLSAFGCNSAEAKSAASAFLNDETAASQTCDILLQEDVALLASINPHNRDTVMNLRSLWWGPQASAMLHSLALKHTAFAGAVRLAVLWLSKQLVVGAVHFAEHVMAHLFVDHLRAGYGNEPQSPHVALLRFLHFIGSFDWEKSALLVSFDSTAPLTDEQRRQMHISFEHFRHFPSVQSSIDPHGFILPRPEPATFRRLIRCARDCSQKVAAAWVTTRQLPGVWRDLFCTDWRQFDIIVKFKDPLAASQVQASEPGPTKKRRFANLAFDSDKAEHQKESLLGGLLRQEGSTHGSLHLAGGRLHLSPSAPETTAVLDGLLLRALGSRACIRRYLLLRFLRRLSQIFPDAFVVGLDFVQAQQLAGGLPDVVALKIPPAMLLCKALEPTAASPRLLVCPSKKAQSVCTEESSVLSADDRALIAVVSPSMLLGGITTIGLGILHEVQLV